MFDLETIKAMNQPGFKAHKTEPIISNPLKELAERINPLVTENQAKEIERLRGILAQIESYPSAKEGKSISEWTEADAFHAVRKLARQGLVQYKVIQSKSSE